MTMAQITTAAEAKKAILDGSSRLMLKSKSTGTEFSYKVTQTRPGMPYWVALIETVKDINGNANSKATQFLGSIFEEKKYVHGKKSNVAAGSPPEAAFKWVWEIIVQDIMPEQVEVWYEPLVRKNHKKTWQTGLTLTPANANIPF